MSLFLHDVRYAFRSLRRSPGFTAVVVATLGLGIGVNVALMSVVRAVLLRPLPYGGEERVVSIWSQWEGFPKTWVSVPEYRFYRDTIRSFDEVALYSSDSGNLTDDEPERVGLAQVTPNLFAVFGIEAPLDARFLRRRRTFPTWTPETRRTSFSCRTVSGSAGTAPILTSSGAGSSSMALP